MNVQLEDVEEEEVRRFVEGSVYKGTWKPLGMEGIGRFVLPYKSIFEGELRDNTFHGHGSAYWARRQRVDGVWLHGECKNRRYIFNDGLIFRENDWKYCQFPDRRYYTCLLHGLRPAGATLRTNHQDAALIPPTCYDAGIGIFDPRARYIRSYREPRKVLEIPTAALARWIENHCRKGWTEPTGYRQDEESQNWYMRDILYPTLLPFSNDSFECWWKRYANIRRVTASTLVLTVSFVCPLSLSLGD
ncbi:MORN repeat-containing protein 5 [Andrena cerasifolii]|uniref:MORN repeat-containing protein 5 n=1 Tax=Andrena cerasifolii TaxID=2819439 RepID=UPI0040380F4F